MYTANKEKFNGINQKSIALTIGITPETMNRIINGKQATTKTTACCIVKAINQEAEINDYFYVKEK